MVNTVARPASAKVSAPIETIFLRDAFGSLISPERLLDVVGESVCSEEGIKSVVPIQVLTEREQAIFADLTNLFGVKPTNAGFVTYDENYSFKFFSYPRIGLNNEGQLGLLIGADNQDANHISAFVPMVYKPGKDEDEDGEYYLGKARCGLVSIPDEIDKTKSKHYIAIKSKRFIYNISFKPQSDLDFNLVPSAFHNGQFDTVCSAFQGSLAIVNKMFTSLFKNATFPKTGVFLILSNGQITENEHDGKVLVSTRWRLLASSHPNLLVDVYKNPATPLREVYSISCNNSCKVTKEVLAGYKPKYFGLYIAGAHPKNPEWIPEHSTFTDPRFIAPAIKVKFAPLIQKLAELKASSGPDIRAIAESMGNDPLAGF
ncbi:MAG: hypothetical protein KME30_17310 [Iphinoe sp. HA4291-MV1]|jgi:hypothetical protein|nr:hypothetical protein [Iphinoe sp. HA4291-MV1]